MKEFLYGSANVFPLLGRGSGNNFAEYLFYRADRSFHNVPCAAIVPVKLNNVENFMSTLKLLL